MKIIEYEQICTYGLDSYKMGLVIIISDSKIVTREVLLVSLSLAQVKQQIDWKIINQFSCYFQNWPRNGRSTLIIIHWT